MKPEKPRPRPSWPYALALSFMALIPRLGALDPRLGQEIVRLLVTLAKEQDATLIVSLHTLDLLVGNFDRVIALGGGAIRWEGPPEQLDRERLREIYGAEYRQLMLTPEETNA